MGAFDQSQGFAERQNWRSNMEAGKKALDPKRQGNRFRALMEEFGPVLGGLEKQLQLGAQASGQAVSAGLARAGLGSTGLGSALSSGIAQGASIAGGGIRAKILQDLFDQAGATQSQIANAYLNAPSLGYQPGQQYSVGGQAAAAAGQTAVRAGAAYLTGGTSELALAANSQLQPNAVQQAGGNLGYR